MLTARLQDERGKAECESEIGITFDIQKLGAKCALLKYVDRYGDTYFNRIQMDDFLADLRLIRESVSPGDMECWHKLHEFAVRCRDEAHLYLRFIGD